AQMTTPFPLVVTLHNLPASRGLAHSALGFIASRAGQVVCVSQAVASRAPGKNKRVIPNGIDLARFTLADRRGARRELDLSSDQFVVASAARLAPEKGIDLLLQAAAQAPDMTFLIAGSGPDERPLAAKAPKNTRLLGRIENVERLFAACDAVAIPSRSEGHGIVALEAMAAGAAVVAARVGGLGETVRHEETGLLVAPEAPAEILQALNRLKDHPDLRARLGDAGREYALRHADVQSMIGALEAVYEEEAPARA
ncbi:MAG TPA: glycosyltransferase family 4 protein, partial [Capsulimonadaceae bacterium]|nr:glycosyltransferase family 4 protein [Capsulimonadaceae bacterium]